MHRLNQIKIQKINEIALKAGYEVMKLYKKDIMVNLKEDQSPVTSADIIANMIICDNLKMLYPDIPIVSEENSCIPYRIRKNWDIYWCIDPIDGTKEFIQKNGEFTINIALIQNKIPVLGVVYVPIKDSLYYAKKGEGAYLNGIKLSYCNEKSLKKNLRVVRSRTHHSFETQQFIDNLETENLEEIIIGSSLKLCLVAEDKADIYPRLSQTMEWDIAAGDAIVREVGKMTYNLNNYLPLQYNKESFINPYFIVQ